MTSMFTRVTGAMKAGAVKTEGTGRKARPAGTKPPLAFALEPRFMFDAAGAATADPAATDHAADPAAADHSADTAQQDALATAAASAAAVGTTPATTAAPVEIRAADPALNDGRREVVFIESDVADYQTLVDGTKAGVEIVLLDASKDGLTQMAAWAQTHTGYDAVHIISYGNEGTISLGSAILNETNLATRTTDLTTLGNALTEDGDILFYGCNIAAGLDGATFIGRLASLTGADIAASDNLTGPSTQGADWVLEKSHGIVTADTILSPEGQLNYKHQLDVFTFETGSGNGSATANFEWTEGTYTLKIDTSSNAYSYTLDANFDGDGDAATDPNTAVFVDSDGAQTTITLTITGKIFDMASIKIFNNYTDNGVGLPYTITSDLSSSSTEKTGTLGLYSVKAYTDINSFSSDFIGVSSVVITVTGSQQLFLNDIQLDNIRDPTPTPTITSATYDANSNALVVTGTNIANGDTIDPTKLTLKGQGGNTYTLTSDSTVTSTPASNIFTITLGATDQAYVEGLLNKDGTQAADATTTFNLAAASGWDSSQTSRADATNAVTVSSTQKPTIDTSNVTYNQSTGVLTVAGANLVHQPGATNDIDLTKLTITGQGSGTRALTGAAVEITSATSFTVTLSGADKTAVDALLNKNGTSSTGNTTYNLAAADDWNGPIFGDISDASNAITVSGIVPPRPPPFRASPFPPTPARQAAISSPRRPARPLAPPCPRRWPAGKSSTVRWTGARPGSTSPARSVAAPA